MWRVKLFLGDCNLIVLHSFHMELLNKYMYIK